MSVAARLAAFAAVLVLCFAAAFGVGAAVGPIEDAPSEPGHSVTTTSPPGDRSEPHGGAPVDPGGGTGGTTGGGTSQHGTGHGG